MDLFSLRNRPYLLMFCLLEFLLYDPQYTKFCVFRWLQKIVVNFTNIQGALSNLNFLNYLEFSNALW